MKILSKRQILLLHQQLVDETGGSPGLRDEGLGFGSERTLSGVRWHQRLSLSPAESCQALLWPGEKSSVRRREQADWRPRHAGFSGRQWPGAVLYAARVSRYHSAGGRRRKRLRGSTGMASHTPAVNRKLRGSRFQAAPPSRSQAVWAQDGRCS